MEPSRVDLESLVACSDPMDGYAAELLHLRETWAGQLASFPTSLQQIGQAFLQRHAGRWNRVDWVLPLILGRAWSVPRDFRHTVALANAHMVMYGYIQQRAGDDRVRSNSDVFPFGSLLHARALRQYQQLFPPSSGFWTLLEGFQLEWAEAIFWQRKRQWGQVRQYSQEDVLRLAGNRALVKVGGAAIALLAERPRIPMCLGSALDQVHVAIQLIDSLVNWQQDLQSRRATYFLTEAAFAMGACRMAALGGVDLEAFLSTSSLPDKVVKRALSHLSTAKKLVNRLEAPTLMPFLDDLQVAAEELSPRFGGEPAEVLPSPERIPVSLSFLEFR
jgi:hypothetical protein